jgi:hypothetical protein
MFDLIRPLLPMAAFLSALLGATPAAAREWSVPGADAEPPVALPERPALDPTTPFDLRAAVFAAAERFDSLNRSEPDLERLVLALALDPKAAFAHVRDKIASVAYRGRFRDPDAVLIAGAGNPHDKAATLAELLTRMGYDTRLVTTPDTGAAAGPGVCPTPKAADDELFLAAGLGPEILDRVAARAAASYGALTPFLKPAESGELAQPQSIWLQVRDGADWVDLDPWSSDSKWGDAPAEKAVPLAEPPASHTVEVRLLVETLKEGALRQSELLRAPFAMPEAAEDWVTLSFGPDAGGIGGILSEALGGLQGVAAPMKAVLTINGEPRYSRVFPAPGVPSTDAGLFADDAEEITTGIWLELRGTAPGREDDTARRTIVDLVPAPVRVAHADGQPVDPAALLRPAPGDRYPAALESIRHILMSNGGISGRQTTARTVRELLDLPDTAGRVEGGQPDPEALLWSTWLQARRATLASEELVRLRPVHAGGCAVIDRPRVTIWGLSNNGEERLLQWFDWALDSVGIVGGDAVAQARMRLWHGAIQSGLETEALMWMTLAPPDTFPPDSSPMVALDDAMLALAGDEATADQAAGFLTLADANTGPGYWWRIDPRSGRADARARSFGNARYFNPWSNYVNASRGGIAHISEAELARLEADLARLGPQGFADEMGRLHDIREAERARKKGGGGNEYVIILNNVSIPASIAVGTVVGAIVIGGLSIALYGQ